MRVERGTCAIIGAGGKSTLLRKLAEELSESGRGRVVVATSTKMYVPDWCPVVLDGGLGEVEAALASCPLVCVGAIHAPTGKLDAPRLAFDELAQLADYVIVEADGAKGLPLKAHAPHEPVIPSCASRTVCVAGVDGIGGRISQVCHRPERFAQLAGLTPDDAVTPEALAAVLGAEGLHDTLLINKVTSPHDRRAAEALAALVGTPVMAGSLQMGELQCLR